jgi:4-hydroxybenzoate polyprenyltransferase
MSKLLKAIVFSNIWVGLACGCLAMISVLEFTYGDWLYPLFVALSTATAYNYMRIVQKNRYLYHKESSYKLWVKTNHPWMLLLTLVFTCATAFVFWEIFSLKLIVLLLIPGIISLMYPLTFKKSNQSFTSLRMLPGVKIVLIAFSWSYVTHLIPVILYSSWGWDDTFEMLFRTLFVIGLTIPFDVRDLKFDLEEMKTLPQLYGVKGAVAIALAFFSLYQLWVVIQFLSGYLSLSTMIAWVLGLEVGYWIIKKVNQQRNEDYFSFWIEGIPVYMLLLIYLGSLINI